MYQMDCIFKVKVIFNYLRLSVKQQFSMDLSMRLVKAPNISSCSFDIWTAVCSPMALLFYSSPITFLTSFVELAKRRNFFHVSFDICDADVIQ